jgi:8-oxo-dGTP pyrophosphatase MutT (NUDIX family)
VAAGDGDPQRTAERETREELSLDLAGAGYLGRLDDLYGATLSILVSCFVYAAPARPHLQSNHEVEAIFWIPLDRLLDPGRHRIEAFPYRGLITSQPVVDLLGPGTPRLWGITYRLLRNFFGLLQLPFGLPPA